MRPRLLICLACVMWASAIILFWGYARPSSAAATLTAPPAPHVFVTMGYDDGYASGIAAAASLNRAGFPGTFYVPTGSIGLSGRMTWTDVAMLRAAGNEIAGHTVHHPSLALLGTASQRYEICTDRFSLAVHGFPTTSFAYPRSSFDAITQQAVAECGYSQARMVGPAGPAAPRFELIPPSDAMSTRSLGIAMRYNTSTYVDAVRKAEQVAATTGRDQWVQFVFHMVCDAEGGRCPIDNTTLSTDPATDYRITTADHEQLVDFLSAEAAQHRVRVMTPQQVVAPTVRPALNLAPPAVVQNSGFDRVDAPGTPTCWMLEQRGGASGTLDTIADDSGRHARLQLLGDADGADTAPEVRLAGERVSCTMPTRAGHLRYGLRLRYSGTGPVLIVFYLDPGTRTWRTVATSRRLPSTAAGTWADASLDLPAIAPDIAIIAPAVLLRSVGTVLIDDVQVIDRDDDLQAPTISVPTRFNAFAPTIGPVTVNDVGKDATTLDVRGGGADEPWGSTPVVNGAAAPDLPQPNAVFQPLSLRPVDVAGNAREYATSVYRAGSMEWSVATGGRPVCMWRTGWGDWSGSSGGPGGVYQYARLHEITNFERVRVDRWASGARSIVIDQSNPDCFVRAGAGQHMTISARYRSQGTAWLMVSARVNGAWRFIGRSAPLAAADDWAAASWTSPTLPAGTDAVSGGLQLASVGTLDVDDLAVVADGAQ